MTTQHTPEGSPDPSTDEQPVMPAGEAASEAGPSGFKFNGFAMAALFLAVIAATAAHWRKAGGPVSPIDDAQAVTGAATGLLTGLVMGGIAWCIGWCGYRAFGRSQFVGNALAVTVLVLVVSTAMAQFAGVTTVDRSARANRQAAATNADTHDRYAKDLKDLSAEYYQSMPDDVQELTGHFDYYNQVIRERAARELIETRDPLRRAVIEITLDFRDEMSEPVRAFHQQLAVYLELEHATMLEMSDDGVAMRWRDETQRLLEMATALAEQQATLPEYVYSQLVERGFPMTDASEIRRTTSQKLVVDRDVRVLQLDVELCEQFLEQAQLLYENFYEWYYDPETDELLFDEDDALERFNEIVSRIEAVMLEQESLFETPADGE